MADKWNDFYDDLKRYFEEHGHCYVPLARTDLVKLRNWLHHQREAHSKDKLPLHRVELLELINVDWDAFGPHWDKWESHLYDLAEYAKNNGGSVNVSQLVPEIGPWLSSQRVMYRHNLLPENRKRILESIGVEWSPSSRLNDKWMLQFEKVKAFQVEHGHSNVPRRTMPDPGIWVSAQRTAYRKGTLSQERIDLLNSIGFVWDASHLKKGDTGK